MGPDAACPGVYGKARLILFTRYPTPGKTKTRLIPALGARGAAQLHRRLAERALACVREAASRAACEVEVRFDGCGFEAMVRWLGRDLAFRPQGPGDLGERMDQAFAEAFEEGVRRVVLVGTDLPTLSQEILSRALQLLGELDLVLGPAEDGGYYLVGLRLRVSDLFRGIPWGTGEVLARTLAAARRLGLGLALLDTLRDVDRSEDLEGLLDPVP